MSKYNLIRFTASWCGPCKQYAPIFDEFVGESNFNAVVVDIDKNPELASQCGVQSVPTTVLTDPEGVVVSSVSGVMSKPSLRKTFVEPSA